MKMAKPLMLLIRDGWGIGDGKEGDAVAAAATPNMDRYLSQYPNTVLGASGLEVGLRPGAQGSSEVGHLNMGAGRIVEQEVVRVDKMIEDGSLFEVARLREAVQQCKARGTKFHLMGLVQDQGVHATEDHLYSFLNFLAGEGLGDVCIHFFCDGRDTPPRSAMVYLERLEKVIESAGTGRVASVMGRYWGMDRAENWDRTKLAYDALVNGEGRTAASAAEAIEQAYKRGDEQKERGEDVVENDEFITPTLITDSEGRPFGLMEDGDAALHFNYRQDRAIQLTRAFVEEGFSEFDRGDVPDLFYMGLTRYYDDFPFALIPPMNMDNLLGEILSRDGLRQLRIAEYQKFRHVTSFFNGKLLEPFAGEDRILVESTTLPEDQKPEMSAPEVTELAVIAVRDGICAARNAARDADYSELELKDFDDTDEQSLSDTYDVIMLNYANGDMVGHTGVFEAASKAIEVVDECLGKVVESVLERDGIVLITADHGNAERMTDPETGGIQTAHTTSPVEFVYVSNDASGIKLIDRGKLADIAPTMLRILGMDIPPEMTAQVLIQ
jgi:2,3-bisphosphoglycerate-independent phosphoglycerate mutase